MTEGRIIMAPHTAATFSLIASLALLATGCSPSALELPAKAQAPAIAPSAGGSVPRVPVGPIQRETLRRYTKQPARVLAFEETPLHSRLSAYVDRVEVDIGDTVEPEKVLI